ncbi:MAG: peptidase S41, partial [Bacteroidetes bacterium]|nr:peptidase S41 [Bacteroidota bacterium]
MVVGKKVIVSAALLGITAAAAAQMNPREKMAEALKSIQEHYVDSLPEEKLADAAIAGMMQQLDPHSRYFSREEALQMREAMSGNFYGIGISYLIQGDSIYITQVNPDGPAAARGL